MQRIFILILSAALGFSAACEDTTDDPHDAGSTEAGNGGSGGKSGSGGNTAGKGGSGGKAGSAGHANAGSGGKSGGSGGHTAGQDADAGSSDDDAGESTLPQAFKISFSTTECFGKCPVYSVTLDQSGNVEFDGRQNVDKLGKSSKKVSVAAAGEVFEALQSAGYFELKDAYAIDSPDCERARTDAPTYKWSVEHDGKTKPLSQYLGCEGVDALDKVREVSKVLIEKAEISEWIGA